MPVIITIMLAGSRSTYVIWLTYHLYLSTCTNVFQAAIEMGIDQEHGQNKAVTQGMDEATTLVNKDDESRLARWELC